MHFSPRRKPFLADFTAHEESYTLKLAQIMATREFEDTERHLHREEEDEMYNATLKNGRREDELMRTRCSELNFFFV